MMMTEMHGEGDKGVSHSSQELLIRRNAPAAECTVSAGEE